MNPIHARLLIVSNDARTRQHLRAILSELHVIQIDEASTCFDALVLHQQSAHDLVVADWDLPRVSGIELLRAIRNGSSRSHTSFVMMTADQVAPRTIEALRAGVNGMLTLPLEAERARDKLLRIIGGLSERSSSGALRAADLWSPGDADRMRARRL